MRYGSDDPVADAENSRDDDPSCESFDLKNHEVGFEVTRDPEDDAREDAVDEDERKHRRDEMNGRGDHIEDRSYEEVEEREEASDDDPRREPPRDEDVGIGVRL